MRQSRFVLLAAFVGVSLAAPATASARWFELKSGSGKALVQQRGAVIGNMRRGKLVVTHLASGTAPQGSVRGCQYRSGSLRTKLVCRRTGGTTRISFYINSGGSGTGRWRIEIRSGRGVNVSGSVVGRLVLQYGTAGYYRLNATGAWHRWPWSRTEIPLR